jgi:selenium metabolism protein YedF
MKKIDCTGLACPEPVLKTKELLDAMKEGVATVFVDNVAARENVSRFARSQGCEVTVSPLGGDKWEVSIVKGCPPEACAPGSFPEEPPVAVLFLSDRMGSIPELGQILMRAFVATLPKATVAPRKLLFMNAGVNLTCEGSPVLEDLTVLSQNGVEILSCGTCLDFLGKKDQLKIGIVGNMFDSVETLTAGHRVVTIT